MCTRKGRSGVCALRLLLLCSSLEPHAPTHCGYVTCTHVRVHKEARHVCSCITLSCCYSLRQPHACTRTGVHVHTRGTWVYSHRHTHARTCSLGEIFTKSSSGIPSLHLRSLLVFPSTTDLRLNHVTRFGQRKEANAVQMRKLNV